MRWPWVMDEVRAEVVVSLELEVDVARVRIAKARRVKMMKSFILMVLMSS